MDCVEIVGWLGLYQRILAKHNFCDGGRGENSSMKVDAENAIEHFDLDLRDWISEGVDYLCKF